jgi:ferrous iron transport protein A
VFPPDFADIESCSQQRRARMLNQAAAGTSSGGAIPLLALEVGRIARIVGPAPGGEIPRRLADLGFVPGTELCILRRAPLGDPVEIEIRGYRLCLRLEQIDTLFVEPIASERGP